MMKTIQFERVFIDNIHNKVLIVEEYSKITYTVKFTKQKTNSKVSNFRVSGKSKSSTIIYNKKKQH